MPEVVGLNHNWKPRYAEETEQQLVLSPKLEDTYKAVANLLHERDSLQPEERSRFDNEVLGATGQLLEGL